MSGQFLTSGNLRRIPGSEPPFYTDFLPTTHWSLKRRRVFWPRLLAQQAYNYTPEEDGGQGHKVGSNGRDDVGENVYMCEEINSGLCSAPKEQEISLLSDQAQ